MLCAECDAFLSNYRAATERYSILVVHLSKLMRTEKFGSLAVKRLKAEESKLYGFIAKCPGIR